MNHGYATLEEAYDYTSDQESHRGRSPSIQSGDTYVIGRSRSPSVLSDVSSPISNLDMDDYDSDRDPIVTHQARRPEKVPSNLIERPVLQNQIIKQVLTEEIPQGENKDVIKHILRIQRDLQKIIKDEPDEIEKEFPFVEIGLFISVGLFILIAMNMMLKMGKHHVTYRFSAD